jgi:hypothetical protein
MLPTMVIFSKACTSAICRALIRTFSSVSAANPPRHDDARAAQVVCRCCSQAAAAGRSCSWVSCGAVSSAARHWRTINERPARPPAAVPARHAVCKRAARNCISHGAQPPTAQQCCSMQSMHLHPAKYSGGAPALVSRGSLYVDRMRRPQHWTSSSERMTARTRTVTTPQLSRTSSWTLPAACSTSRYMPAVKPLGEMRQIRPTTLQFQGRQPGYCPQHSYIRNACLHHLPAHIVVAARDLASWCDVLR